MGTVNSEVMHWDWPCRGLCSYLSISALNSGFLPLSSPFCFSLCRYCLSMFWLLGRNSELDAMGWWKDTQVKWLRGVVTSQLGAEESVGTLGYKRVAQDLLCSCSHCCCIHPAQGSTCIISFTFVHQKAGKRFSCFSCCWLFWVMCAMRLCFSAFDHCSANR